MDQKTEPFKSDYFGMGKAQIDTKFCTNCGLCNKYCRFKAIKFLDDKYIVDEFSCEGCSVCEASCPQGAIKIYPAIAGEIMVYKSEVLFTTAQLKMGSGTSGKLVSEVKKQLNLEETKVDLAIIDGSPGIGCPVIASLSGVDMVLIVTEPSLSGISDMERIVRTAQMFNVRIAVCVNKYDSNLINTIKIEEFCVDQDLSFVGRISFDQKVVIALNKGESIIDFDCATTNEIKSVYKETMDLMRS